MLYTHRMQEETLQAAIAYLGKADPTLRSAMEQVGRLDYALPEDGFSFLVEVIIGQMLSAKAADTISARLKGRIGGTIQAASLANLDEEELRSLGIARRKAQTILTLAALMRENPLLLSDLKAHSDSECMASLCKFKGIGPWTAKMYLIFVLDREDVLPLEDGAFLQAYRYLYGDEDIEKRASIWKPYRSLAARYLYRFLDLGYCS